MRRELKKRGVKKLTVVYSDEKPISPDPELALQELSELEKDGSSRRSVPGSVAFVPSVAGLTIAGVVVRDLAGIW